MLTFLVEYTNWSLGSDFSYNSNAYYVLKFYKATRLLTMHVKKEILTIHIEFCEYSISKHNV